MRFAISVFLMTCVAWTIGNRDDILRWIVIAIVMVVFAALLGSAL